MKSLLKKLAQDATGTSAVEYGIILAMIFLAIVTAVKGVSNENNNIWTNFSDRTQEAISAANGA
jgi:pilus assembly protein Flp/PilA